MAKTTKSYTEMLKEELLVVARRLGLTNLSRLRKAEILDLVRKATAKKVRKTKAAAKKATAAKPAKKTKATTAKKAAAAKPAKKTKAAAKKATKKTATQKPVEKGVRAKSSMVRSRATKPKGASTRAKTSGPLLRPSPLGPVSHQANAMASKYVAGQTGGPEDLLHIDNNLPDLPESYGDNRIVLMPRDLSWLFTYWDLTEEYKDAARSAGGNVLALRLYDVTGLDFDGTNSHGMYEHECTEWARSWYLPTPAPDRDYIAEIGYRGADQWFPLARSNKVSVPSDQPSTWIKDDFISINFDEDLRQVHGRFEAPEQPQGAATPTHTPPGLRAPEQTILDDGELRITVGGAFLPPSGGPTWPPFSRTAQEGPNYTLPSSQSFIPGSLGYPSSYEFMTGSISHLPSSPNLAAEGMFQLPSSPDLIGSGVIPFERLMGAKQSAPQDVAAGSDQPASSGPGSEPGSETPLMVTTMEMVIAGRSVPGASLRIAGRPIPLGPDGCFSLRITVPEGTRELPIEARSHASGEVQRVTLHLGRETE